MQYLGGKRLTRGADLGESMPDGIIPELCMTVDVKHRDGSLKHHTLLTEAREKYVGWRDCPDVILVTHEKHKRVDECAVVIPIEMFRRLLRCTRRQQRWWRRYIRRGDDD
jgi:hypothetical protein